VSPTVTKLVDAVIFDFGGVLTDPLPMREEMRAYDALLGLEEGTLLQALGSGEAWEDVSVGRISETEYWDRVAAEYVERLPAEFRRFERGMLIYEPLNEEVVEIVQALKGQVKLGLLSNATISMVEALAHHESLQGLFDDVVVSAQVGLRKPDPEIYDLAVRRLGVGCGQAALVDDKQRNTLAAQNCGMMGIDFVSPAQLREDLRGLGLEL